MADASPYGRTLFSEPFDPRVWLKNGFFTANVFEVDTVFLKFFGALDMKNGIMAAIWETFWGTDRLKDLFL